MLYLVGEIGLLIGSLCLYLRAPHQKLWRSMPPTVPVEVIGVLSLITSAFMLANAMSASVGIFSAVVMAMTFWSLAPLLFAWRYYRWTGGR